LVETAGSTPNHKCPTLISSAKPAREVPLKGVEKQAGSRPKFSALSYDPIIGPPDINAPGNQ